MRRWVRSTLALLLRWRSAPFGLGPESELLTIAPHSDDACLGCGGLLVQRRLEGLPVTVAYLTDGSASHPGHPIYGPPQIVQIRKQEAFEALRRIGVDGACVHFVGLPDGRLDKLTSAEQGAAISSLRKLIEQVRPTHIALPCLGDGSTEHAGAFQVLRAAARASSCRIQLLEYPVWSWWSPLRLVRMLVRARRVWRVDYRGYQEIKRRAISAHASQIEATPPWTEPVLPREFAPSFTAAAMEFLFEMEGPCGGS